MVINKTLLTITFLLLCKIAFCQEFLTPLRYNPLLVRHSSNQHAVTTRSGAAGVTDTTLPISDDFSYHNSRYPSNKLWMDSEVYIDDNYGVNPPSIGVAVFDGLNKYGIPYDSALFSAGGADTLTSRPINLRLNSPADDIYLSFFYQPQGNGDVPQPFDSLILEFNDTLGNWDEVWGAAGDSLTQFVDSIHQYFQQVLIPVTDLKYFHPGFQFRFRNYATLSANANNWCIDYVRMAPARFATDTIIRDVAFQYNSQSILKNYTQMPWNQFYNYQATELRDSFSFYIRNNFPSPDTNNVNINNSAFDLNTRNNIYSIPKPPSVDINPESALQITFPTFPVPTNIGYVNTLHNVRDTFAKITVKTNIKYIIGDINTENDTIYHNQYFYNYYAYDNGTPESAYSLLGNGEAPELAYEFSVNKPDTIRAVQIYFVFANADDSNDIFDVQVWSSLNDTPIYTDGVYYSHVAFGDSLTGNGFHTYILSQGVPVTDSFYVGFLQTDLNPLYVGYDVNDNDSEKLYFNVGYGFQQSQFHGAVMIRPVLGDSIPPLPTAIVPPPLAKNGSLKIYPNPAKNLLTVKIQNTTITGGDLSVENILGQTLLDYPLSIETGNSSVGASETIDVSALPAGMYFLHLADNKGTNTLSTKFVKIN